MILALLLTACLDEDQVKDNAKFFLDEPVTCTALYKSSMFCRGTITNRVVKCSATDNNCEIVIWAIGQPLPAEKPCDR